MDTIFIAAAPGTTWPPSRDDAEEHLLTRFPDTRTWRKHAPATGRDYLDFQVEIDGEIRLGSYFEHRNLVLTDGTPDVWADTIAWFLNLLPADSRVVAVVESNPDSVRAIPPGADAEQIREILQSLVDIA
ncbi:hypothetical protein [Kitasatospora sp. NPDC059599]|uniref:hypothetical protein n=1 Tax=Kitasatospora sp. NPDC059599 TaxID=3346880 RepID=UPI0036B2C3C4